MRGDLHHPFAWNSQQTGFIQVGPGPAYSVERGAEGNHRNRLRHDGWAIGGTQPQGVGEVCVAAVSDRPPQHGDTARGPATGGKQPQGIETVVDE